MNKRKTTKAVDAKGRYAYVKKFFNSLLVLLIDL